MQFMVHAMGHACSSPRQLSGACHRLQVSFADLELGPISAGPETASKRRLVKPAAVWGYHVKDCLKKFLFWCFFGILTSAGFSI